MSRGVWMGLVVTAAVALVDGRDPLDIGDRCTAVCHAEAKVEPCTLREHQCPRFCRRLGTIAAMGCAFEVSRFFKCREPYPSSCEGCFGTDDDAEPAMWRCERRRLRGLAP